jgi:hypothetical protein
LSRPDAERIPVPHARLRGWAVAAVVRVLTFVDILDEGDGGPDARRMSVSARHEAVLADGRRVVLLDDRGWTEELRGGEGGIWAHEAAEEIERTARVVVGPDEAFEGRTQAEMESSHWESLAQVLRQEGIEIHAAELGALPHDVELSDRVLARLRKRGRA